MTTDGVTGTVHLPCSPETAWSRFTERFAEWWPREHCLCGEAALDRVYLDLEAGAWGEVRRDGTRTDWGLVEAAEPPALLVLGWQMDARPSPWIPEPDPARASRVTVRFAPEDGGTRVTLTHDRFGAHGDGERAMTEVMVGLDRWREWLDLYAAAG